MLILLSTITVLMILCTLASLCKLTQWWIRVFDFPRLQFASVHIALLAAQLFLLDPKQIGTWLLLTGTAISLGYQLWWILPYTPLVRVKVRTSRQCKASHKLAIFTANVLTSNRNSRKLLGIIRSSNPDIIVTLESDQWWQSQLDELQDTYPHTLQCPLDNLYGMHVYSKLPLHEGQIDYLVEDDKPSMHARVELRCGRQVRMHFLHPAPPSPTENLQSLERDAELLVVGKSVANETAPVVITGDLNDVAWSKTSRLFKKTSGLLDPRIGRGLFNTFNAKHWYLRWPLDHFFHSGHFTVAKISRLPGFGSDHFPLYIELCLEDEEQSNQLNEDKDDRQRAREKLESAGVDESDVPSLDGSQQ